jgi:hypothetical protein
MPPITNTFEHQPRFSAPPSTPKPPSTKTTPLAKTMTQPKNPSLINISIVSNASFCQILKQKQGVGYMMDVAQIHELSTVQ